MFLWYMQGRKPPVHNVHFTCGTYQLMFNLVSQKFCILQVFICYFMLIHPFERICFFFYNSFNLISIHSLFFHIHFLFISLNYFLFHQSPRPCCLTFHCIYLNTSDLPSIIFWWIYHRERERREIGLNKNEGMREKEANIHFLSLAKCVKRKRIPESKLDSAPWAEF